MKILLTGATGFIGRALTQNLAAAGHEAVLLTRDPDRAKQALPQAAACYPWRSEEVPPEEALHGAGAVVHLAGESVVGGRWTAARRTRIYDSRIIGIRRLLEGLRDTGVSPQVIVSSSAVGYYGDRGEELLNESSAQGTGFLAEVCADWEAALFGSDLTGTRCVALRTGMVLGTGGGALARLLPLFRVGLGGPVGSGRQWISWIHLADMVALILYALENPAMTGVVNAVAPNPVTNREFARTLGRVLRRPALLPAPAFALKLALGEMATIVLDSQRVEPRAAAEAGFRFRFDHLREAMEEICR
ncbi:MAG: TIGR01777 family oxidoreductase [SAR324 cluster bacterium]|nr:TIGR01777 family oxidoreductase [SAR324 cluster bacterium]